MASGASDRDARDVRFLFLQYIGKRDGDIFLSLLGVVYENREGLADNLLDTTITVKVSSI